MGPDAMILVFWTKGQNTPYLKVSLILDGLKGPGQGSSLVLEDSPSQWLSWDWVSPEWKQNSDPAGAGIELGNQADLIFLTHAQVGEGNGDPLWYSCLENPMDGGAW